ncbi:succinylglutamate desuccinylase/aspartoacylase family protein [Acetobacteraceae bacterium H6797]|nr:succinylglutamate desuccinylase/aspartoacylase family protein [Acetobacteraceae bacterium H6797]
MSGRVSGPGGSESANKADPLLSQIPVRLAAPDISPWLNGGPLRGVQSFTGSEPGPHVAITALIHGNEIGGAILLDRWLREGLRPARGRLSLIFANIDAFARFDPNDPTQSRYLDEDMNRVWDPARLAAPMRSIEARRARELRPLIDTVDLLLDLHSMLWQRRALFITGVSDKARDLALKLGTPPLVVADEGHANGRRLVDYPRFSAPDSDKIGLLVEAGLHWEPSTIETMEAAATAMLRESGIMPEGWGKDFPPSEPPRLARVTRTVVAVSHRFGFLGPYCGGEVIPRRNTLIALDGEEEIRTPHDNCLLVMPSLRVMRGHTAVRLARFES